jgi:hypothetical protein
MAVGNWTKTETEQARHIWKAYQQEHDVSAQIGQTAGIDPVSGRVWFGKSAKDIVTQMESEGVTTPLYFMRVGSDYYLRKGGHR